MDEMRPIRTPLKQHLRRIRYQFVPVAVFALALASVGVLWRQHRRIPNTVGEVEVVRIPVRATVAGFLEPLDGGQLQLFDKVVAGREVARLDDSAARQGLLALRREAERLEADLKAVEARMKEEASERSYDRLTELRRLAVDVERYRLEVLRIKTDIQTETVIVNRLEKLLALVEKDQIAGAATAWETEDLRLRCDESKERITGLKRQLVEVETDLTSAGARMKEHRPADEGEIDAFLEPFRRARDAQEARAAELARQIDAMTIRAPISGTIVAILRHPGQAVQPGEDIVTIAADYGRHVVAYVRQYQRVQPQAGMPVAVHTRIDPGVALDAIVVRVGPQVEEIPPHQRLDPARLEWGLPVMISIPTGTKLCPGELVDIAFRAN